jgi:hypothetical protein
MTEKQVFGVIIRGLGVYFSTLGVQRFRVSPFSHFRNLRTSKADTTSWTYFQLG